MANTSFKDYLEKKIKQKPALAQVVEKSKKAIKIAHQIYQMRKKKGLTQQEFAKMIGVSQSNIARIESADYNHYTITTLDKVARALGADLNIFINPPEQTVGLISALNYSPTFQSFIYAGMSGRYFVSGSGTFSREGKSVTGDMRESQDIKISAEIRGSEKDMDKYYYQTL